MIKVTKAEVIRFMELDYRVCSSFKPIQFELSKEELSFYEDYCQRMKQIEEYTSGENKLKYIDNNAIYLVCSVISDRSMSVGEIMETMNITASELEIALGIDLDYENFRVSRGCFQ